MRTRLKAARMPGIAFFLLALGLTLVLTGCPARGLNVKVYFLSNNDGGLVRRQENELVRFPEAEGYRCMNPQDFDATVQLVRSCLERRP